MPPAGRGMTDRRAAEPAPPSGRGQRLAAFHHRNFTLYWLSQVATNIGSWMQQVATGWLVLELTNSPAALGFNALLQGLPLIGFGLIGGVVADRFDRYRMMLATGIAQLIPDVMLATLVLTGDIRPEHVYVYSLTSAAISGVGNPARQSLVPSLVPRPALLSALALASMTWQGSAIIGPALAGLALASWGLPANFNLNVLSDLISLGTLLWLRVPRQVLAPSTTSGWQGIREGLRYAWHDHRVKVLLLSMALMTFLARPYTQFMPVFARDVFHVGPQGLGLMLTMPAVGTIAAAFGLAVVGRVPLVRTFWGASVLLCLVLLGFALTRSFPLALGLLLLTGACITTALTTVNTRLQEVISEPYRGRVMGLYQASNQGSWRLGATPAGLLANLWGAPLAISLGAVVLLGVLAALARGSALWEAESEASRGRPS
jgi:MFS family permease